MTPCAACPTADDPAIVCDSIRRNSPAQCRLVAAYPHHGEAVRRRSLSMPPDPASPHRAVPAGEPAGRPPATPRAGPPAVSVVVAARNYGAFLRDALASAMSQTARPVEVFYADDGSDDDSLEIARSVPGVTVLPGPHAGVCAARNRGAAAAAGEYLIHLDGDDILPEDFVARRLEALARDPGAAIVYGPAQTFGAKNNRWDVPDWDAPRLWTQNWINTSAMVRADDLWAAGGWREGIGTSWDWDLFLRMARGGARGIADRAGILLYRQHDGSVSARDREADGPGHAARMFRLTRTRAATVAIGCVLSDRILELLPAWCDAIRAAIDRHRAALAAERPYGDFGDCTPDPPNLHVVYTGDRGRLAEVRAGLDTLLPHVGASSMLVAPQGALPRDEAGRRHAVARLLAGHYNRLVGHGEDIVWTVEDDVIPPPNALHDLVAALLGGPEPIPAAAGWYRSRHNPDHLIAHDCPGDDPAGPKVPIRDDLAADRRVDLTGTGCLAIFRPLAPHAFGSHLGPAAAHDWAWCRALRDGGPGDRRPLLLASVGCRHHQTVERWVGPGDGHARPKVLPACRHRRGRWCCGEGVTVCDIGHGAGGIIEKEDCYVCKDAEPA